MWGSNCYPSGALGFWGSCRSIFSFICSVLKTIDRPSLFAYLCIVCPSIYGFWLSLWYPHIYDLVNRNSISMSHIYDLVNCNSISMSHIYDLVNRNSISMSHIYDLVNCNSISMSHIYDLVNRNSISMSHIYDLVNRNSISMSQITTDMFHFLSFTTFHCVCNKSRYH
jgi:predicted DNA-binding transcriptional regulator AlpA